MSLYYQALEKANQAKSISADSTVKVREAISSVNEILISLNNMGNIGNCDSLLYLVNGWLQSMIF